MSESTLWDYMRRGLPRGHWRRIENVVLSGDPDVNGCVDGTECWIELKVLDAWPKRKTTPVRIDHYTKHQRQWAIDRTQAGGKCFLFVRVIDEYFLFTGLKAAMFVGDLTKAMWYSYAIGHWDNKVDWEDFICKLKSI